MKRFFSNPFMLKELRQLTRSRMVVGSLLLYLGAELVALWMLPSRGVDSGTGASLFSLLNAIYFAAAVLLIPLNVFFRTCRERGSAGVPSDLVLATPLSPSQVVDGKFLSATALSLMFATALLPFAVASYTLHGLHLATAFAGTLSVFLGSLVSISAALAIASLKASRAFRWLLIFLLGAILFAGGAPMFLFGFDGLGLKLTQVAVLLSVVALCRALTVSCISPSGAERSRGLRLTALVVAAGWLVWAAIGGQFAARVTVSFPLAVLNIALLVVALSTGYGYSRRQLAERRCWIFATGALNGTVFALALGFVCVGLPLVFWPQGADFTVIEQCEREVHERVSALCALSYCAAAMLVCRFVWRQVRRWRELPAFLVPLFGFSLLTGGVATFDYLETYCGISLTKMIAPLCGYDAESPRIELAIGLLAVAVAINLPAAVKVWRMRWQPTGESNSTNSHEKAVS